jgi:hypothetical protein
MNLDVRVDGFQGALPVVLESRAEAPPHDLDILS